MSHLRRNLIISAVVFLVADLALLGWLLSPRAPSQSATREQLAMAHAQLVGLRLEASQLHRLNQRLRVSQQEMEELMAQGIPEEADASSKLLREFSRIAGLSQVQVSGAEFNPDKDARLGLRRYAISVQVAGGYSGVVRFINEVERSPMFFIIDQVSVSGGGTTAVPAASGQLKLEVQLEAYVRTAA